jgi:hypothetical protein
MNRKIFNDKQNKKHNEHYTQNNYINYRKTNHHQNPATKYSKHASNIPSIFEINTCPTASYHSTSINSDVNSANKNGKCFPLTYFQHLLEIL